MTWAWHWRVVVESDLDVKIGLAIVAFAFVVHSYNLLVNYAWMRRANGTRPFVRAMVWSALFFVLFSGGLLVSSSQQRTVTNTVWVEVPYILIRVTLLASTFVMWRLSRDLSRIMHKSEA